MCLIVKNNGVTVHLREFSTFIDTKIPTTTVSVFMIKFRYNARSDWLKQRALSGSTPFCWRCKLKTFIVRACKLWKKLVSLQIKTNSLQMWAKLYYKTNKKAKTMPFSVIKHARKWREHERSVGWTRAAGECFSLLLECSHHFLACFITEQITVLAFFIC